MQYEVIYDKENRLRLRSGRYAFTEGEGYGIAKLLLKKEYIKDVFTSSINGSLLIKYDNLKKRKNILEFVRNLKEKDIEESEPSEKDITLKLENEFFLKLSNKIVGRILYDIFVPIPIKTLNVLYAAFPYIIDGLKSLYKRKVNVSVLDMVAISMSIYKKFYGSAGSIMFLLSISDILEEYTIQKTKNTFKNSLAINIDTVWKVMEKDEEVSVPLSEIVNGNKIKIRTGGLIPVDGVIANGDAMINESSMTGEPLSIHKGEGTTVHAGTVVEEGSIVILVEAVDEETRINKIIELIEESESLKANIQSKAEKLADSIVPFSLFVTLLTYLVTRNSTKALSILMVDYSCAIKLSTPISVISAMQEASNHKIMIKGGRYLENYAQADTIVFDKTGTLTKSSPKVADIITCGDYSRDEILKTAACIEEHFAHSVARAIVNQAESENLKHEEEHAEVEYIVAHGISTTFRNQKTMIGSAHFIFEDEKIPLPKSIEKNIQEKIKEYSAIYLAIGGKLEGIICIEDPIRPEAKRVIAKLKDLGIENVIMLTGDSENAAKSVSEELGILKYKAQVLPEDKAKIIDELKKEGKKVIMVGDGINDSPALSSADVSVSMKDSSDITREIADISLLSPNLDELVTIRLLSQNMLEKIQNNYSAIVIINTSLIGLGMLGFISPSTSSLLHNLSTVAIGGLSTRSSL
ncbi:putative copper-exporting P-type ATPase V [Methanobrevibacter cuticularis]|uniref:Putative copper-exporting P-type ATPase V n=1 Tax=Methanobrevibacter cuticularis TaxID=47311 RepID=A0A166EAL8_9EURY|nr:heavy metal translocating P-type ATPase [Methanobrevibacter cuticularis]KZX16452.1 putative copper-exporting P-type ATPase V [Methanobrevibacter cuticularis]